MIGERLEKQRVDYQPAWLTDELNKLLDAVGGGPHHRKRRTTILRLAEGAAIGRTETDTLKLPDTCTRSCWYGQGRPDGDGGWIRKPGWRDDPAMEAALEAATRRAHWWIDQADTRRMEKRLSDVARAKDELARLSFLAAQTLGTLLGADSEESKRKAANDILDRADESTASKGGLHIDWRKTAVDEGLDPDALLERIADIFAGGDGATDSGGRGESAGEARGGQ